MNEACPELPPRWLLRDHVPLEDVIVQSHRGAGDLAPENTLAAFRLAWEMRTIPEADLRQTRDDTIIAFHDDDLGRVARGLDEEQSARRVDGLTWRELAALDVGSIHSDAFAGERIPTFSEIAGELRADATRRLYADSKAIDLVALAAAAHAAGVTEQLILAAPDHATLQEWLTLAPTSATLLWMGGSETELAARLADIRERGFRSITQLQVHVHLEGRLLRPSPEFLARVGAELRERSVLFQVLPWGISDPETLHRLLDLGVASLASDRPDIVLATLRAHYAAGQAPEPSPSLP